MPKSVFHNESLPTSFLAVYLPITVSGKALLDRVSKKWIMCLQGLGSKWG